MDENVVNYVAWKVDGEQKTFLNKMVTIRKRLVEAMDPDLSEEQLLPIRFLLDEVKIRQDQFMGLHPDMRYQTQVRRVMGLIDASKAAISSRID